MVSIIVPVYNAEKTLVRCVQSIINQSYKNWELILIDDGSTDASSVICDRFVSCNTNIQVVHQTNMGVSSARNAGLEKAQGDWITFVDSDDYIDGDFFSSTLNTDSDLVIQQICFFSENESIHPFQSMESKKYKREDLPLFFSKYLNYQIFMAPWGKIFRRSMIEDLRFPVGQIVGEDALFNQLVIKRLNSIEVSAIGQYCYFDVGSHNKYMLTVSQALSYLHRIFEAYLDHGYNNQKFLALELSFFTYTCRNDCLMNATRWFSDRRVRKMFMECKNQLTFFHRMKFMISMIPGMYKTYHFLTGKWV